MEVRKRDGNILIGHAPTQRGDNNLIVRQRLALPFAPITDSRSAEGFLEATPVVETFVFEVRGTVILVDDQDPYLIPGFIPFGKALSYSTSIDTSDVAQPPGDVLEAHAAQVIAEKLVKGRIMHHAIRRHGVLMTTTHRFSVYVTQGNDD